VAEREAEWRRLETLRDRLERAIVERVPDAVIHGRGAPRAPHIVNVSVPGVDSESLLMALDLRGIAASGGSACQSGNAAPSHVLLAMGVPPDLAASAVRMSLGSLTTESCIERVASLFPDLVRKSRAAAESAW
jgi:cysteine desulfurase